MKGIKILIVVLIALGSFVSCTKEPGIGGNSSVTGKIYVENYNSLGTLLGEYYAQDYDVSLIYGDADNVIDDDVKTSYDGSFEFKYLNKGKYKLFVYSAYSNNCTVCPSGQDSVITVSFAITDKKQVVELKDITVLK